MTNKAVELFDEVQVTDLHEAIRLWQEAFGGPITMTYWRLFRRKTNYPHSEKDFPGYLLYR